MTIRIETLRERLLDPTEVKRELVLSGEQRASALRNVVKNVGLASSGIAAGAIIQGCSGSSKTHAQTVPETDVLNFALNLEYLEAEFYSKTVNGVYLDSSVTGGARVDREMSKRIAAVAMSSRIGETFDAIVTAVTSHGTFVRILKPAVEGLLTQEQQGADVGDKLGVKLIRADTQRGYIHFARD